MPALPETSPSIRVGLVGARGHTGRELLRLIAAHPALELAFASSRQLAGQPLAAAGVGAPATETFTDFAPDALAEHDADVYILALPNGLARTWVTAIDAVRPQAIVLDLSADHRFDAAWTYGLPEHGADALRGARRIANPGCYATAMQLAIRPVLDAVEGVPHCFGVSGYSGAGTTPSPRNDPEVLRDNLVPYALAGHVHEREVSHRLGRAVRFAPHVAPFFRGLSITALLALDEETSAEALADRYERFHAGHRLVRIERTDVPLPRDAVDRPGAAIGGFTVDPDDPRRIAVVATLDNLLKGAATQAIQNINLACGRDELEGIEA